MKPKLRKYMTVLDKENNVYIIFNLSQGYMKTFKDFLQGEQK